jgi:hypothetical protein
MKVFQARPSVMKASPAAVIIATPQRGALRHDLYRNAVIALSPEKWNALGVRAQSSNK